jgi:hypothetical protein
MMQKNNLEANEKCDGKLGGVFFSSVFFRFRLKTKITQVKVKQNI